jgi:hypothetical protein
MYLAILKSTIILTVLGAAPLPGQTRAVQGPLVHTIAPNTSTQREAQRIVRLCRWTDTTAVRDADVILVVVRSSGSFPLAASYANLKWLYDEANSQLNDSGAQYHVYLYIVGPDGSFRQVSHHSYDVWDGGAFPDSLARARQAASAGLACGY